MGSYILSCFCVCMSGKMYVDAQVVRVPTVTAMVMHTPCFRCATDSYDVA